MVPVYRRPLGLPTKNPKKIPSTSRWTGTIERAQTVLVMSVVMMPVMGMMSVMPVAEPKIDTEHRSWEARQGRPHKNWCWQNHPWRRNVDGRMMIYDLRSGLHDYGWWRSINHCWRRCIINRWVKGVHNCLRGHEAGQDFSSGRPFAIARFGLEDTRARKGYERESLYCFIHIFSFFFRVITLLVLTCRY